MSNTKLTQTLMKVAEHIMRPLIRILLRNGISHSAFVDISKRVYVDVAEKEFGLFGKKQTASRISTITGLTRKDVAQIKKMDNETQELELEHYNRASRVISGWITDVEFLNDDEKPSNLPIEGKTGSFTELVKRYSGDITPRTIADELTRVGAIKILSNGYLQLLSNAYIPDNDAIEKLTILGTDVPDLINTIDHNLSPELETRYFQRKVCYENIPEDLVLELQGSLNKQAQTCLESMNKTLANTAIQAKSSKKHKQGHHRIGVGIYYFEEDKSYE